MGKEKDNEAITQVVECSGMRLCLRGVACCMRRGRIRQRELGIRERVGKRVKQRELRICERVGQRVGVSLGVARLVPG